MKKVLTTILLATILLFYSSFVEAVGIPMGGLWGQVWGDMNDQTDLMAYLSQFCTDCNTSWGDIEGDINDQTDVFNLLSVYNTNATWGYITGDLNDQTDVIDYITAHTDDVNGHSWVGQDLRTTASPTFVTIDLTGLTDGRVVVTNDANGLSTHASFAFDNTLLLLTVGDYNSADWSLAYDWGNHASAGYLKRDGSTTLTGNWNTGFYDVTNIDGIDFNSVGDGNGLVQSDEWWSATGGSDTNIMSEKAIYDVIADLRADISSCYGWNWTLSAMTIDSGGDIVYASDGNIVTLAALDFDNSSYIFYLGSNLCDSIKIYAVGSGSPCRIKLEAWYDDQWNVVENYATNIPDDTWTTITFTEKFVSAVKLTNAYGGNYLLNLKEIRFHVFGLISSDINDL